MTIILPDGRRLSGKTLGVNRGIDSGLMKITQPGEWPFVEIGRSGDLVAGEWVVALGHPGGFRKDRPPVLRLGRVLTSSSTLIGTDCTLVGGDSGGPLFNLDGQVVGIHSRIGESTTANIHVPIDSFTLSWDRLAAGEAWGDRLAFLNRGPVLGVEGELTEKGYRVDSVAPDGPAARAGVKVGDLITRMNDAPVDDSHSLGMMIVRHRVGDKVGLKIDRDGKEVQVIATLGKSPG